MHAHKMPRTMADTWEHEVLVIVITISILLELLPHLSVPTLSLPAAVPHPNGQVLTGKTLWSRYIHPTPRISLAVTGREQPSPDQAQGELGEDLRTFGGP